MKRLTSNTPLTEWEEMNMSVTNLYARLKEYENTGLEPEDIKRLIETNETHMRKHTEMWKDLEKYLNAEAEGRFLVMPCKMNDQVWAIVAIKGVSSVKYGRARRIRYSAEDNRWIIKIDHYKEKVFGETIFLSKEEAISALKKLTEKEANDGN